MAQAPSSYKDPAWDAAEEAAAKRTGVPKEVLSAIRLHGEKSNADQVSPVGARGVYQFMPKTERLFFEKYGVSAYSNDPAYFVSVLQMYNSKNCFAWDNFSRTIIFVVELPNVHDT